MKAFKKIASLCLGLTLCAGLCAFAACEKEAAPETSSPVATESSSTAPETEEATAYVFTVLDKDGNPLKDYRVLLCRMDGANELCLPPVKTDTDGKAVVEPTKSGMKADVYDIHVMSSSSSDYLEFEGEQKTAATYGEYTLKLKA